MTKYDDDKKKEQTPRRNAPQKGRDGKAYPRAGKPTGRDKGAGGQGNARGDRRQGPRQEGLIALHIDKLDDDLCGVAYRGSDRYIVRGALPDEDVLVQETEVVGSIHVCRLKRIRVASPQRVQRDCRIHGCGGCDLRHMTYEAQLQAKTALVKRKLHAVYQGEVSPCIAAEGLRNKVHLVFGTQTDDKGKSRVTVGFFDAETHAVVDAPTCAAHGRWYAATCNTLRAWAQRSGNRIYDPVSGEGVLRFAVVRHLSTGTMVTIVACDEVAGLDALYEGLTRVFPRVSLWFNRNANRTNAVFSDDFRWIAGPTKLQGELLDVTFGLGPDSFFQTNTAMARVAYRLVREWVGAHRPVLDLFCGVGITGALFARNGCSVDSVDSAAASIEDARELMKRNGVADRVTVHCGTVQQVLPTLAPRANEAVFVDPPRAGLGEEVCRAILQRGADTVVYMSCNVATLAQDLALLCPTYTVVRVQPLDMFPGTRHVETVARLSRNDTNP